MSFLGMIPALLVLLALLAFTDTSVGRGVRRAVRYLWRTIRQQNAAQDDGQDDGQDGQAMVGQVVPPVPQPGSRWRSLLLPFRRPPAQTPGVGHVNAQVSGQGAWQGGQQGPWQGPPVGASGWGPGAWSTGPVTMPLPGPTGFVPAWGPATLGQAPAGVWSHPATTWTTGPVPTGPVPVPPVTQPAAGVYLSGQGRGVRLDPGPQQVVVPSAVAGGDLAIAQRRAAVADALPYLEGAPHGEQGRIVAALAAAWRVDPRTIYRDIEALPSGRVSR